MIEHSNTLSLVVSAGSRQVAINRLFREAHERCSPSGINSLRSLLTAKRSSLRMYEPVKVYTAGANARAWNDVSRTLVTTRQAIFPWRRFRTLFPSGSGRDHLAAVTGNVDTGKIR